MYDQMRMMRLVDKEIARTGAKIDWMENKLTELPEGSLLERGDYLYRLHYEGGRQKHIIIPQGYMERDELIKDLCDRRYISRALPILQRNLRCCRDFRDSFKIYDLKAMGASLPRVYRDHDCSEMLLQGDIDPAAWASADYECNKAYPERKRYRSEGGVWVRSKSEADIATKLEQKGFSFRYEEMICVDGRWMAPDFTILCIVERRVKYWEHFGMMDDPCYAAAAMDKLCHYAHNGIRMGDNLIVTWETSERPLLFDDINDRIDSMLR